mmetsp:Transcript_58300/g.188790  ORF Transcript_58300/g.188790 Transcript_58300/m.188790 type:complete len:329 (-) Transcript_58300:141-1127(-)
MPKPMTRYFPRDSGEQCSKQILTMLKRNPPALKDGQQHAAAIHIDYENFSGLAQVSGVRWLTPEFAMVIDAGPTCDLPDTAFGPPGRSRPFYISYPHAEPEKIGLTAKQLARLRIILHENESEGRVMFYDSVSISRNSLNLCRSKTFKDTQAFKDVMLMAKFIILDDVDPDGTCKDPYLSRGQCFMEAVIAVLTGNFLPIRPGQLDELDSAIGRDVSSGKETLREVIRVNARSPSTVINRLCTVLKKKKFPTQEEREYSVRLFADMLARHPWLIEVADSPAGGHQPMTRRLSFEGIKKAVTGGKSSDRDEKRSGTAKLMSSLLGGSKK